MIYALIYWLSNYRVKDLFIHQKTFWPNFSSWKAPNSQKKSMLWLKITKNITSRLFFMDTWSAPVLRILGRLEALSTQENTCFTWLRFLFLLCLTSELENVWFLWNSLVQTKPILFNHIVEGKRYWVLDVFGLLLVNSYANMKAIF